MLESIYYVISWACRRACPHCYDERFRPYSGGELEAITSRSKAAFPAIVSHLPETMVYTDLEDQREDGSLAPKVGRIVLSGGEVLLDPVRTEVLYPLLGTLTERYKATGGVKLVIQTAGDLLSPQIIDDLLDRDVWMISVSSLDDFHQPVAQEGREAFRERLAALFESAGMRASGLQSSVRKWMDEDGPVYSFFGATPDAWIGKLWPSGRAWENGLSKATFKDNFCNNWSGGLNFLNVGFSGSEVAIDPDGNLYPRLSYGNVTEEPLIQILESLVGRPEFEAIAMGRPERMGIGHGVDVEGFLQLSRTANARGEAYVNRCIGCDRFH
ncbi:MAG: radical SAM protein, partial [Syntrophobacteraceae bacterium]|nr:radical SAM protein [Syntrophobacteraceae bacterium]